MRLLSQHFDHVVAGGTALRLPAGTNHNNHQNTNTKKNNNNNNNNNNTNNTSAMGPHRYIIHTVYIHTYAHTSR